MSDASDDTKLPGNEFPNSRIASPASPESPSGKPGGKSIDQRQLIIIASIIGGLAIVIVLVSIYLLTLPTTDTTKIRDIFIILLALEAIVVGVSVVVMMIQLAKLLNLMQNEIKPMLESTEITINNLRGTTEFLSENMVEPVIKLNETLAALRSVLATFRLFRR
jgi:hypothetical protein